MLFVGIDLSPPSANVHPLITSKTDMLPQHTEGDVCNDWRGKRTLLGLLATALHCIRHLDDSYCCGAFGRELISTAHLHEESHTLVRCNGAREIPVFSQPPGVGIPAFAVNRLFWEKNHCSCGRGDVVVTHWNRKYLS